MLNLFNIFVYGQMFFFMWLFNANIKLNRTHEHWFYFLSLFLGFILYQYNVSVAKYSNLVLIVYVFLVIYTTYMFSNKFTFRRALALGFLIPFLNSYYWESVLHFGYITFYGLNLNQFIQAFHLIPIFFLLIEFDFDKDYTIDLLSKGLVISFILHYLILWAIVNENVFPHNHIMKRISHLVLRFFCLNILIKVVYDSDCKRCLE